MSTDLALTRLNSTASTDTSTQVHTFQLSSLDQSLIRGYIRYCLVFPCNTDQPATVQAVCEQLRLAVRRTITHLPILAGTVRPVQTPEPNALPTTVLQTIRDAGCARQQGRLEVKVTLKEINDFTAIVKKYIEGTDKNIYSRLNRDGMPPAWLMQKCFTPLPDNPDPQSSPAFAVQASFISGGLLVALYLNHSVADLQGISTIMRLMSSELPSRKLNDDDLHTEVGAWALGRQILSDADGAPVAFADHPGYKPRLETALSRPSNEAPSHGRCHILSFNIAKIEATKEMINKRLNMPKRGILNRTQQTTEVSKLDCLSAILWQAITRSRCDNVDMRGYPTLVVPVNSRSKILPPLDEDYFGNGCFNVLAVSPIATLVVPFSITSLTNAALLVRESILKVDHKLVKSGVAIINDRDDVRSLGVPNIDFDTDCVITSWDKLPTYGVDLGLGLGNAQWGRKISQNHCSYGCIVLPKRVDEGLWEVMLQLTDKDMDSVLGDKAFMGFVARVA